VNLRKDHYHTSNPKTKSRGKETWMSSPVSDPKLLALREQKQIEWDVK